MKKIIDEEKRKELGDYLKKVMAEKNIGFNQLSIKTQINIKPLNEILYGRQQKINPFYLQIIAYGLRIDYKELYKIVGYLNDDDFNEAEELKKKLLECETKLEVFNNHNTGSQIIGNNLSNVHIVHNEKKLGDEDLDISELSEDRLEELKKFIKYLKNS